MIQFLNFAVALLLLITTFVVSSETEGMGSVRSQIFENLHTEGKYCAPVWNFESETMHVASTKAMKYCMDNGCQWHNSLSFTSSCSSAIDGDFYSCTVKCKENPEPMPRAVSAPNAAFVPRLQAALVFVLLGITYVFLSLRIVLKATPSQS